MVDVTVMGAGVFGLSVAWFCVQKGAAVRVIDPAGPGSGASGGTVGALAPHTPENWNDKKAFQFESLRMAEAFWASVDATSGLASGYARLGRLQPVDDADALALAEARAEGAASLWQGFADWRVIDATEAGDWAPGSGSGKLILDTLSARLNPRAAIESLSTALRLRGADVVTDRSPQGRVVWATGWRGLRDLSDSLGQTVGSGVKGQSALLAFDAHDKPQLFVDGLHIVPHGDGTLAIGSTSEREFDSPDATDTALADLLDRAALTLPILRHARVIDRWAGVRPRARSRAPMLGPYPDRAGHFIANGGFKIGFGMAPRAGQVMADLVLDGVDAIPEGFLPQASL